VGKGSAHTGYRSFEYPRSGVDHRTLELSTDLDRVEPEPVALSADQEGGVISIEALGEPHGARPRSGPGPGGFGLHASPGTPNDGEAPGSSARVT
jgi:hypothetical protein